MSSFLGGQSTSTDCNEKFKLSKRQTNLQPVYSQCRVWLVLLAPPENLDSIWVGNYAKKMDFSNDQSS